MECTLLRIVYDAPAQTAHTFRGTRSRYKQREYCLTQAQYGRLWTAMSRATSGRTFTSYQDSSWQWDREPSR